jgi:predicted MFS family arabinose efflux permease
MVRIGVEQPSSLAGQEKSCCRRTAHSSGVPGVRPLALACGLGWLAFTGYTFAIILAVHVATGSFAVAGGVVAAFGVGSGLGAPARGRVIDSYGHASLGLFTVVHVCFAGALVAGCARRGSSLLLLVCGGLAGLFAPPLIATARSIWPQVAGPELAPLPMRSTQRWLMDIEGRRRQLLVPPRIGSGACCMKALGCAPWSRAMC